MTFEQHHYDKRWINVETSMPLPYELVATMTVGGMVEYDWLEPVGEFMEFAENHGPVQYWMNLQDFHLYGPPETVRMMRQIDELAELRRHDMFVKYNKPKASPKPRKQLKRVTTWQQDPMFAYAEMTEEQYIELWRTCYPGGSGPLGTLKIICGLIESLAKLRGFDPSKWVR